MAEHKRIPFETVKPINKEKKASDLPRTLRFNLPLHESNEKTCPEFSYGELVKSARDEKKEAESDEPFGGDDDDQKLREIARRFEEKYGPKGGNKKRKSMGRWEDYIDRGMGYDESDPFIDNDEAYDELVPSTLTTQFGGFYINSGELEFRTISDTESDGPQDGVKRRKRRRRRDADDKDLKRKRTLSKDGSIPGRGRGRKTGLDRASALAKAKRKAQPTVATLLQERKAQLMQQQSQENDQEPKVVEIQEQQHPPPKETKKEIVEEPLMMAESPLPAPVITSSDEDDAFAELEQLPMSDDKSENNNINDIIESVIRNSEDVLNNGNLLMYAGGVSSDGEDAGLTIVDVEAPKLPENLSNKLNELVKQIKQAAISSEQGKCKFFTHDVNKLLLNIELKSRELSCTQRSMIYSHLASFLPCTKETLLKRAKKLRLDQEDGKLHEPLQRLKNGICEVLPAMMEKFSAACLAAGEGKEDEPAAAGSDEDDDMQGKEEKKGPKLPKKKFEWNDHIRELLCEVVRIKLKCYEVSKMRTQSAEEYLYQFLDQEICKLWPVGWVNTRMLLKESRSAHAYATTQKPNKKPLVMVKKLNATPPSQVEVVPQSPIVKYSNVPPQTMVVQENQPLAESLPVPTPQSLPAEEIEEKDLASVLSIQTSLNSEDRAHSSGMPNLAASAYLDTTTMEQNVQQVPVSSPSKRIFTLMNTEEAAQVVEAQKSTSQKSFASTMLDRIICASLADYPNSGTSTQSVTIERTPRSSKAEPVQKPLQHQHQQQDSSSKPETVLLKTAPSPHLISEASKSSSTIYSSSPAVSILKSNYQSTSQPQQTLQQPQQQSLQQPQQQTLHQPQQQTLHQPQQQTLHQPQQQTLHQPQQQTLHQPQQQILHQPQQQTLHQPQQQTLHQPQQQTLHQPQQQTLHQPQQQTLHQPQQQTLHQPQQQTLHQPQQQTLHQPQQQTLHQAQQQTLHQPQQQTLHQPQSRPTRVLDHISSMPVTSSMPNKQVSPNSMSNPLIRPGHSSSLPMQTYEFQEAFKRSLAVSNNTSAVSAELQSARNFPRKRQVSEDSDEQPVNFSNPQSSAHYVASQELNRLASSALGPGFSSQPTISTTPARVPRSSPEASYQSGFAEGMKGFPLPLKNVVNPPPAHSYASNRRTSPSSESGFTSPHRHNNSQSPHQLASSTHSPPQSVANHSPYQSTAPLSHFTAPDSAHTPRSIIQTAWRNSTAANSTPATSSGFSLPSQYSTASSSSSANYNLSPSAQGLNHNMPGLGPAPGHHFLPAAAPTSGQRSHTKAYSSASPLQSAQQAQQAMQRSVYGQMYAAGSGYPTTGTHGSVGIQYCEPGYGQNSSQALTNYHGVTSLTGPGQQGSHTRIP